MQDNYPERTVVPAERQYFRPLNTRQRYVAGGFLLTLPSGRNLPENAEKRQSPS
jgi:hypothetical protein